MSKIYLKIMVWSQKRCNDFDHDLLVLILPVFYISHCYLSKYQRVTVSSNISWDKHIQNVAVKGNMTLGLVKRNKKDYTKGQSSQLQHTCISSGSVHSYIMMHTQAYPKTSHLVYLFIQRQPRQGNNTRSSRTRAWFY